MHNSFNPIVKTLFLVPGICLSLVACNKVDDYILGKDNSPQPQALAAMKPQLSLQEKWAVGVGASKKSTAFLKLRPIVTQNTIYTADASGAVSAVDKNSGAMLWSKTYASALVSGPSVGQGLVVVGTGSSKILALNRQTGHKLWQAGLSSDALAAPLIVRDKVLVKTIDGNLYAFDSKTGKKLWASNHGAPGLILKASSAPIAVNDSMALVGYSDGKLDAIDLATGRALWQKSIAYSTGASDVERLVDVDADPIVQGDRVYIATYQGYLGALSLASGEFIWRRPASTFNNIIAQGNAIYMVDSKDVIWSVNKTTGAINWKQKQLKARGLTEPAQLGNYLIVGDKAGFLHVLSTQTGEFLGRTQLGAAISTGPAVSGGSVYSLSNNGKLTRFTIGLS